jgi:hypothetical protein
MGWIKNSNGGRTEEERRVDFRQLHYGETGNFATSDVKIFTRAVTIFRRKPENVQLSNMREYLTHGMAC